MACMLLNQRNSAVVLGQYSKINTKVPIGRSIAVNVLAKENQNVAIPNI